MSGFTAGLICGVLLCLASIAWGPSYHRKAREAIIECEKNLPRNMECKVIAIPNNRSAP